MGQETERPFRVWIFSKQESQTQSHTCDCYYDTDTEIKYDIKGAKSIDLTLEDLESLRIGMNSDGRYAILVRDLRKEAESVYDDIIRELIDVGGARRARDRAWAVEAEKKRLAALHRRKSTMIEKKRKQLEKLQAEVAGFDGMLEVSHEPS